MQSVHTVSAYDGELNYLTKRIAAMGGHAERMVEQAIAALVNADPGLAQKVVADDAVLDDAQREIDVFTHEGCCYSFRDWHDDVNAVAVPFREPRDGRWLVLSCSGPASSMGEAVFRETVAPRLKALARRLGDTA